MPGLVRKILIFAIADGLVLQPLAQKGQHTASSTKISFKDKSIDPILESSGQTENYGEAFEAFGIVGRFLNTNSRCELSTNHLCRPSQCRQILLFDIDHQTPAGCADPRKANICHHRGSFDTTIIQSGSRSFDYLHESCTAAKANRCE